MNGLLELLWLSTRNLLRNHRRTLLSGANIAIGVAALLCCKAYVDGLQRVILEFVIDAREGALQVQRQGYGLSRELAPLGLSVPDHGPVVDAIASDPAVRQVTPRLRFLGMVSNGEASMAFSALGVDPAREAVACPRGPGAHPRGLLDGPGLDGNDTAQVVVGAGLAHAMKLHLGDVVTLLVSTQGGALETADLTVAGLYAFPDPFENKHLVVLPLARAQRLVHMSGRATTLVVALHAGARLEDTLAALRSRTRGTDPAVELHPWYEIAPYFRDVIELEGELLVAVIAVVFLLVVAGVVSTMLMSVLERTREIGTLMALGLDRRRILGLFLVEATQLTLVAAAAGVVVGAGLVAWAGHVGLSFELPGAGSIRVYPHFRASYVAWSVAGALGGGLVGGLLPARRAARMRPIEALRSH